MSKGILEMIAEAPEASYDPRKGITMDELSETVKALSNYKPRKPEYILSKHEAETLPLWQLTWLGENYIVLCSIEVAQIVKQREESATP